MSQFLNTLEQIVHSDSVGSLQGFVRHSQWQLRKLFGRFPCQLPIAHSHLYVDRPGGVAALVNAMGEYDYNNMRLLSLVLSNGKRTFFDIGANIGSYTLVASESPDTQVVSIEPHPATFAFLKQNVEFNARNNVLCLNVALSDVEGSAFLTDNPESSINQVVKTRDIGDHNLRVPCRRFDSLCRDLELQPDFIKIDVEGYEQHVLNGFGDLAGKAKVIFIEGGENPNIQSVLQCAGYSGPWLFHFKQRRFSMNKQARPEDPVYLKPGFIPELREKKIVVG